MKDYFCSLIIIELQQVPLFSILCEEGKQKVCKEIIHIHWEQGQVDRCVNEK